MWGLSRGQREIPFHTLANTSHHIMSARASAFNLMYCASLHLPFMREVSLCRKDLPGFTTRAAWCSSPTSDSSSHFLQDFRDDHLSSSLFPSESFLVSQPGAKVTFLWCQFVFRGMSTLYMAPHISLLLEGYPMLLKPHG